MSVIAIKEGDTIVALLDGDTPFSLGKDSNRTIEKLTDAQAEALQDSGAFDAPELSFNPVTQLREARRTRKRELLRYADDERKAYVKSCGIAKVIGLLERANTATRYLAGVSSDEDTAMLQYEVDMRDLGETLAEVAERAIVEARQFRSMFRLYDAIDQNAEDIIDSAKARQLAKKTRELIRKSVRETKKIQRKAERDNV